MKQLIIIIVGSALLGCGVAMKLGERTSRSQGTITNPNLRDSYAQVTVDEAPFANIRCSYVGKKPEAPIREGIERDWKQEDTDFYHYTISNVYDQAIELERIEYAWAGTPDEAVFKTDDRQTIERDLGASTILPGESLTRRNAWVWGEHGKSRVLKKTYHVRSGDRATEFYVSLRYQTETQTTTPDSKRRGFESVVNVDKTPVANISCEYLGKKPEEPIAGKIERDWTTQDTDFYHYTISNASSHAIELKQIEYSFEQDDAVFKTDERETIERDLGTTTISPGESVTRRNSWIGGESGKRQTLKKTYHIRSDGRDLKLSIHLPYRPDRQQ